MSAFDIIECSNDDTCPLARGGWAEEHYDWFCHACGDPIAGSMGPFVVVRESPGAFLPGSVGTLSSPSCALVNKSFLERFFSQSDVQRDLLTGPVYLFGRELVDDWLAVFSDPLIEMRGSKEYFAGEGYFRRCEACNTILYAAAPPYYLYPEPDAKRNLFLTTRMSLLVRRGVADTAAISNLRGMKCTPIGTAPIPLDGLGDLSQLD